MFRALYRFVGAGSCTSRPLTQMVNTQLGRNIPWGGAVAGMSQQSLFVSTGFLNLPMYVRARRISHESQSDSLI
jgi:hypothetical protein